MPTLARLGQVRGLGGIVAMPGRRIGGSCCRQWGNPSTRPFRSPALSTLNAMLSGVTRDGAGAPIAGCTVDLFRTSTDERVGSAISDGAGAFSIFAAGAGPFYLVAYKAGSPDVSGTTANTLLPP